MRHPGGFLTQLRFQGARADEQQGGIAETGPGERRQQILRSLLLLKLAHEQDDSASVRDAQFLLPGLRFLPSRLPLGHETVVVHSMGAEEQSLLEYAVAAQVIAIGGPDVQERPEAPED